MYAATGVLVSECRVDDLDSRVDDLDSRVDDPDSRVGELGQEFWYRSAE
jgi:hypothetical protein